MHAPRDADGPALDAWAPAELARAITEREPALEPAEPADLGPALLEEHTIAESAKAAEREHAAAQAEAARLAHEQALNEAYARGLAEGRAEGELIATEQLRTAVQSATQALAMLRTGEERWTGALEDNIAATATAIARHMIEREVGMDPEIVRTLVRTAVAEFPIDQPLRIRVNPQDLATITMAQGLGEDSLGRTATWTADPALAHGECIVEGRERIVDGRIDTALERVYRRLSNANV